MVRLFLAQRVSKISFLSISDLLLSQGKRQKKEALRKEANAEVMKAELAVRTEKLDGVSNEEEWEAEVNKLFDELPDGGVPLEAPGEAMNADI